MYKNNGPSRLVFGNIIGRTKVIAVFLITIFSFNAFAQNHTLSAESAAAFLEKVEGELASAIDDEETVNSIVTKWKARHLAGKTGTEAVEILLADVRSVVTDADQVKAIHDLLTAAAASIKPEAEAEATPEPKPAVQTTPIAEPKSTAEPEAASEPTQQPTPDHTPAPAPQTTPLDKQPTAALIEKLLGDVVSVIEDETTVESITKKWEARDLAGKTKAQELEIFFEDVKSSVSDAGHQKQIWDLWNAVATEKPEATPEPEGTPEPAPSSEATPEPEATPITEITPVPEPSPVVTEQKPIEVLPEPPSTEGLIEIGDPPLSEADMNKVMNWIAAKVSAEKLPFCWRQSFGRGAGVPLSSECAPGLQKNGQLCYPQCRQGFGGAGPVCWGNCPSGFNDIGAFCQKPQAYGRGVGFPWKFGDPFNLGPATNRCESQNGKGNCQQTGAIIYPKCRPGFHAVGCCVCSPDCPPGYRDTGTGCTKPSYGRGAGEILPCPAGTERSGLLCYPACGKENFSGVGPVCWQGCPSQTPFNCGAACATSQRECATAVTSMVTEPIMLVVNTATLIATLGQSAAATGAAKAAQVSTTVAKLAASANKVKNALKAVKGSIETLVGGPQKLAQLKKVYKIGKKTFRVATTVGTEINNFATEFALNFSDMTSPEIDAAINARFGPEAAFQIKKEWGARHLMMNLEANGFATAKLLLELVSVADPIGVTGVINAFLHPICKSDAKLPEVTPLYNR